MTQVTPHKPRTVSDIVIVAAVIGILAVLFSPIPAGLLDLLLITNFSFALLILLLTFYVDKPLSFSTFPSLLLIATLFRLALNVASTRLVLSEAHAGEVIDAVGAYAVTGSYVIGLVVFVILIVVQYVVVTNGAQRVAEVAARFTLDAMPGKQMSIDADLNMGLIDEHEARRRRDEIAREANFYGAMDGASKFVKGDAIAGIIIILIDIIGGLTIGMMQRGMSWSEALHTYTLLTVGGGIVTQIPALVIATGTGIIVTRAATDAALGGEITRQITRHPRSLMMVACVLGIALVLPGIPSFPVLMLLGVVGLLAVLARRAAAARVLDEADAPAADTEVKAGDEWRELIRVEALEIATGEQLLGLLGSEDGPFMRRVAGFRKQYAGEMGLVLPRVRLRVDSALPASRYVIRLHGADVGEGLLMPDQLLAIGAARQLEQLPGESTRDPTFGLPARWIDDDQVAVARNLGCTVVEPVTVLVTHFSDVVRRHAGALMSRAEAERLIDYVRGSQPTLVEELIPEVLSVSEVQKVLQMLISENVSIRNIDLIVEVLLECGRQQRDPAQLTEAVRERLGPVICQRLKSDEGGIHVLTLDPAVERKLRDGLPADGGGLSMNLAPDTAERLAGRLTHGAQSMMERNLAPVLLAPPSLRRQLRALCERLVPHMAVISVKEIPGTVMVTSHGVIRLD